MLAQDYSKTCLQRPLKNRQNKDLNDKINGSLMKVKSIAECSPWSNNFCNTFDLHLAIIGLENQFSNLFENGHLRYIYSRDLANVNV